MAKENEDKDKAAEKAAAKKAAAEKAAAEKDAAEKDAAKQEDKILAEAQEKAEAEKKERLESELNAEKLTPAQHARIDQERAVRKYIKPDGTFRKNLSASQIKNAGEILKKAGRKIVKDRISGRPMAVPGWDNTIDTRRPLINLKDKR